MFQLLQTAGEIPWLFQLPPLFLPAPPVPPNATLWASTDNGLLFPSVFWNLCQFPTQFLSDSLEITWINYLFSWEKVVRFCVWGGFVCYHEWAEQMILHVGSYTPQLSVRVTFICKSLLHFAIWPLPGGWFKLFTGRHCATGETVGDKNMMGELRSPVPWWSKVVYLCIFEEHRSS